MNRSLTTMACAAALAMAASSSVYAQTVTPIDPFPGSVTTTVFGINDDNVIAGSYVDSQGVEHGFFGPLGGAYTSFDFGGTSTGTESRAIDIAGNITGFAANSGFTVGEEFLRSVDGKIAPIAKKGAPLDGIAQGLNAKGINVGDYLDPATEARLGYQAKNAKYKSDVNLGNDAVQTSPRAIDKASTISGFFIDSAGANHGFLQTKGGAVQVVDFDDSGTTVLEGSNDQRCTVGQYVGSDGGTHSFIYNGKTGRFSPIEIPGSTVYQQAWSVNNSTLITVSTDIGSFIYNPQKSLTGKKGCPTGGINAHFERANAQSPLRGESRGPHAPEVAHPVRGAMQ